MSVIHTPKKPEVDVRILLFPGILGTAFMVLFFRLWYIQVVRAPELAERAEATREIKIERPAPRGLILDRNGVKIASVRPQIVVTGVYRTLQKNPEVVSRLAEILKVDPRKLKSKLMDARRTPETPVPIYIGAPPEVGTLLAEAGPALPGVGVDTAPMRYYPDSRSFTHLLGFVGIPNPRDVERLKEEGKKPALFVGKDGIERSYETSLMGTPGIERTEVDARRKPLRITGRDNAIPGRQLVLGIDADLQRYALALFEQRKFKGGLVALNPNTGEVLAMVSSPTFDQSLFEGGISRDDWSMLQNDENIPMLHRAMKSSYSPGSTFKLVTTLAGLRTGKFDPRRPAYCAGGYRLGKRFLKCLGHHGSITYEQAFAKSCNTYFADLGMRAGEVALRQAALDLGLGQRTGIDIGGESRGVVPTAEWIKRHRRDGRWYGGDTLNLSIGQGEVRCTPLQMAGMIGTIATRGIGYKPHLVREFRDPAGLTPPEPVTPEILHRVDAPSTYWDEVHAALAAVIDRGTATSARIPDVQWGGKTGSTEHRKGIKTHGWFVGFAPLKNPQIAICVLIEEAGHGGDVAAPIAGMAVSHFLNRQKSRKAAAAKRISSASAVLPSLE